MKDRMDPHAWREFQSVSLESNTVINRKGTQAFPIELLRRAFSPDVGGQQPDFVADGEFDPLVLGIVKAGLSVLCLFDVVNQGIVMLSKALREVFCRGELYRRLGRIAMGRIAIETDIKFRMIAVVGIERRASCSGLISVVVREFRKG